MFDASESSYVIDLSTDNTTNQQLILKALNSDRPTLKFKYSYRVVNIHSVRNYDLE